LGHMKLIHIANATFSSFENNQQETIDRLKN
jgi:hypothetical protein